MKRYPFPVWLQRLTSWANARVNFGPRLHRDCGMEQCHPCAAWREHDEAFNEDAEWELTPAAAAALRCPDCPHPMTQHNSLGCEHDDCSCHRTVTIHETRRRPPRPRTVRA